VTLNVTSATLSVGGSLQLTATALDASGNVVSVTVAWSSSNAAVATVTSTGLVTAVAAGTAAITATADGQTASATIMVEVPVASVDVTPVTDSVFPGLTVTLTATPRDAGGNPLTGRAVTWATDNGSVATVDAASGVVTGVSAGMATITATAEGQTGAATITVQLPVASVDVTPLAASVRVGLTVTLTATPRDAGGNPLTGRTVTWASDNGSVATVDAASGVVTGVSAGVATITATSEGQSGSAAVTVWFGVTGSWTGTLNSGGTICPLTQSLTEDATGAVTGNGELFSPGCIPGTYTLAGTNNTGMVADSVDIFWTGMFAFNFEGTFDGTDTIAGVITGVGCPGCTFTFTRASFIPIRGIPTVRREGAAPVKNLILPRN